jgi:phospholipid/cholesterol/gamma-HCH transport system substrate-binding protein
MAIPQKIRVRLNVLTFIVMGFGLSYLLATQVLSILQDRYSVYAFFPDAGGVFTNQEVTYRGITVGQVGDMEVVEEGVKIELLIKEDHQIPADGTEARVMFKSAVGEQFVDLLPTSEGAPYLKDGSEIPLDRTSIPVSTQELLSTLQAVLEGVPPESLKGAIDALGGGLKGRGNDLGAIIENSADLAEAFAESAPNIEGILKSGTKVGSDFLATRDDFETALEELVTVSAILNDNRGNLQRLMRNANATSDELLALIDSAKPELYDAIDKLVELNRMQIDERDNLEDLLAFLPDALLKVVKAFETKTGMIRFSLVNDSNNHACSYGTERRPPTDRSPKLPPMNAECGTDIKSGDGGSNAAAAPDTNSAIPGMSPQLEDLLNDDEGPQLPPRMSDWSWTLLYLNGV